MKNLVIAALATTCFVTTAFAETAFICRDQSHVAELKISKSRIENRSYDECNGDDYFLPYVRTDAIKKTVHLRSLGDCERFDSDIGFYL